MNLLKVNDYKENFNVEIKNRFNVLMVEESLQQNEEEIAWDNIQKTMNEAVETV